MEIAVTVPYEIKIDAEGINLDSFDCFFTIYKGSVSYAIELTKKENVYILKIPKELTFLGGEPLKYEVNVRKENAIFIASEGELTVLGMVPSQFNVDIKPQKVENKTSKAKKKDDKTPTTTPVSSTKPKKTEPNQKNETEKAQPGEFEKSVLTESKFSFLNSLTNKKVLEVISEDPNDPNVKLRKILDSLGTTEE